MFQVHLLCIPRAVFTCLTSVHAADRHAGMVLYTVNGHLHVPLPISLNLHAACMLLGFLPSPLWCMQVAADLAALTGKVSSYGDDMPDASANIQQDVWKPPQGQRGDGKTSLNGKFGY